MKKQISKEIIINAEGKRNNGNCKMVYCIETETIYASVTDAAESIGTTVANVSLAINGKQKTCKGFHIFKADEAKEHLQDIADYYRSQHLEELKAKATAWDAYMEAKNAKAKAQAEIARKREMHTKLVAKGNEAIAKGNQTLAKAEKMLIEIQNLEYAAREMEV